MFFVAVVIIDGSYRRSVTPGTMVSSLPLMHSHCVGGRSSTHDRTNKPGRPSAAWPRAWMVNASTLKTACG